ncbi:MAG TPA: trypsin-like peptidase domain-containing protein [Candidatus Fusicatenibacter merdavium]|uniref:Trypsin-like peptidase domain-containing protein n=1 Tax=Candidatus Fusicatenibacter merdavium TaxID=2838600 RepID=A0A9D1XB36_9FIRM|nr:trypsin-like peptidase domain-containing protein [Candidatus Fusicatenibacter merdavium]
MSEDFRKETEGFSSEESTNVPEASQGAEEAKTYTSQETQHTDSQENTSAGQEVQKTEIPNGRPAPGTTYSWVNPKLTGEERKEDNSASYTGQAEQNTYHGTGESTQHFSGTAQQNGQSGQYSAGSTQTSAGFSQSSQQSGPGSQGTSYGTQAQPNGQQHHSYQSYHIDTPQPEAAQTKKKKDRKVKKPMSLGKKWGMVISMAAVFGIVAGGVFTGTTMLGAQLTGSGTQSTVTIPTTSTNTTAAQSSGSTSSGMSVKDVASSAMPSLVAISTTTVEEVQTFFGTASQEVPASGTGVIVGQNDEELLIATNNHVVSGATQLSVSFIDDTTIEGQIKGTDETNDLAVVAVKLSDIPDDTQSQIKIATMGDSDALEVGDQVVAIGNALGSGQSVTSGYVSALDRDVTSTDETTGQETTSEGLIQTDAAINPGNSGGALLNMSGELIGINEAKYSSTDVEGMGFAIPIAKAEPILENLMSLTTRYKVDDSDASYIGITMKDVESNVSEAYGIPAGVRVESVVEGSPADEAGIKVGDILTGFDGRTVSNSTGLQEILSYYAAGETVDITVQRADDGEYKEKTLTITLGSASDKPTETEKETTIQNPFGR